VSREVPVAWFRVCEQDTLVNSRTRGEMEAVMSAGGGRLT
jgi:hypothetical protein